MLYHPILSNVAIHKEYNVKEIGMSASSKTAHMIPHNLVKQIIVIRRHNEQHPYRTIHIIPHNPHPYRTIHIRNVKQLHITKTDVYY